MVRWMLILLITIMLAALLLGCSSSGGGVKPVEVDQVPPTVSDFNITPPTGTWRGGDCTVELRATDNVRINEVTARISGPGSGDTAVVLSPVSGSSGLYRGAGTVPPNTNGDGTENNYYVTAWAIDAAGNSTAVPTSLTFAIPAPEGPPTPPTQW